jgi:hypothetical protein
MSPWELSPFTTIVMVEPFYYNCDGVEGSSFLACLYRFILGVDLLTHALDLQHIAWHASGERLG